jgi:hypothetical protein
MLENLKKNEKIIHELHQLFFKNENEKNEDNKDFALIAPIFD